jgi:hypothetical protein
MNLAITVNIPNLGFTNAISVTAGNPVTLHTGGNQRTYAIMCNGNNGASWFSTFMATGCPQQFAKTDQPNPPICSSQPPGPAVCVNQDPGGGKVIEPGIDQRVNGAANASTCVSPNHWTSPNSIDAILHQSPPDPRLVRLIIVDSAAWVGVNGTSTQTPVRDFGTFYITGWSGPPTTNTNQGGDPCLNSCPTTGSSSPCTPSAPALPYINDDDPGAQSNVLLGHFVHKTDVSGLPNGQLCTQTTFGNCVAVLTK